MTLVPSRRLVKRDVSYEFMNRQMVWHAFTEFLLFLLPLISARSIQRRLTRIFSNIQHHTSNSLSRLLPAKTHSILGISHSHHKQSNKPKKRGKYWSLPKDQCAICAENASLNLNIADSANAFAAAVTNTPQAGEPPEETDGTEPPAYSITNPYLASCGDLYCYHCIAERMMHALDEGEDEGWECLRCGLGVREADRLVPDINVESDGGNGSEYEFSSDIDATDMSGSVGSYTESERSRLTGSS
jgi:peroxin-2